MNIIRIIVNILNSYLPFRELEFKNFLYKKINNKFFYIKEKYLISLTSNKL
jgi:hypothetical protein